MEALLVAIGGVEQWVYPFAELGLVEAACTTLLARQLQWGECAMDWGRRTDQELSDGLFVDGPSFGADARLERRVYGFEVDARRYDLAGLRFL